MLQKKNHTIAIDRRCDICGLRHVVSTFALLLLFNVQLHGAQPSVNICTVSTAVFVFFFLIARVYSIHDIRISV